MRLKVGFKAKSTIIKDREGSLITDKKKAADEFKDVFDKMLNKPFQVDKEKNISTVEQKVDEPMIEVEQAINMLKTGKAPGENAIIA